MEVIGQHYAQVIYPWHLLGRRLVGSHSCPRHCKEKHGVCPCQ